MSFVSPIGRQAGVAEVGSLLDRKDQNRNTEFTESGKYSLHVQDSPCPLRAFLFALLCLIFNLPEVRHAAVQGSSAMLRTQSAEAATFEKNASTLSRISALACEWCTA
jgi:hypothetical protein